MYRADATKRVPPVARFCQHYNGETVERDCIQSITGGVPKYLESIDSTVSANENVRRLCFTRGGLLVDEFEDIFTDALDENLAVRRQILEALINGPMDVGRIAEMCSLEPNGHLSANLESLEVAGFVAKDVGFNPLSGKKSKAATYRICDNWRRGCSRGQGKA